MHSDSSSTTTLLPPSFEQPTSEYSNLTSYDNSASLQQRPNLTSHFSDSTFASTSTESATSEEFGFGTQRGLPAEVNVLPALYDNQEGSVLSDEPGRSRSTPGNGTGIVPLEQRSTWSRDVEMALGGAGIAGIGAVASQKKYGDHSDTSQDSQTSTSMRNGAEVFSPPISRFTESSNYSDINSPMREHLIPPTTCDDVPRASTSSPKFDHEIRNKARSGTITESSYRSESPNSHPKQSSDSSSPTLTKPNPVEHSPHMKIATRKDSIGRNRLHKDSLDKHAGKNSDLGLVGGDDRVLREEHQQSPSNEQKPDLGGRRDDNVGEGGIWNASVAHVSRLFLSFSQKEEKIFS